MVEDFKNFIMKGNVVDLAVAVVVGAAFKTVVDGFVEFIINPIIAAIFGQPDITGVLNITLSETDDGPAILSIGGFLQTVVNFLIIAAALFVVVKVYEKLQARRQEEEEAEPAAPSDEVVLLTEIRDSLRQNA